MADKTVRVPVDTIHNFTIDVFSGLGVPRDEAKTCAHVLITSDLRGIESHGVGRLKMYYDRVKQGILSVTTEFEIVKETETTVLIDGHNGMGHVISVRAMQMAIDKAKEYGMGSAAVRESTHFGIDGYYPLMAVEQGMIGMAFTNARPSMAPTFGVDPLLGTNPIAFGAPSDEEFPFLYDAATSITQRGKIEVLDRAEKPTPAGWVIDRNGKTATDTVAILEGLKKKENAFVPLGGIGETLGGHKGVRPGDDGGDPLRIAAGGDVPARPERVQPRWQPTATSFGALLHGDRYRALRTPGTVQEDDWGYPASLAQLDEDAGS